MSSVSSVTRRAYRRVHIRFRGCAWWLVAYLIPDLAVVEIAQALDTDHKGDPTRIRLIVEVQSPSRAVDDVREKAEHCASAGIPSYWRIELEPQPMIIVLERGAAGPDELQRGSVVTVRQPFPSQSTSALCWARGRLASPALSVG
jgi:Uma2 family endonuclease